MVSVVTGGAGGMGRACARRFLDSGDLVVLADVDPARVADAVSELGAADRVRGLTLDVTDADCGARLADAIAAAGTLRGVAHTAGLSPTMGDGARVLGVNLVGTVRVLDGLEPLLNDRTAAVCIASQAGHLGVGNDEAIAAVLADPLAEGFLDAAAGAGIVDSAGAYGWSKWAMRQEVIRRAPAWGTKGARIVSLSPGIIDTPMGRQELAAQPMMPVMIEMTPLRRSGTADEIAAVVEFLCSPAASFVTGTDLLVDGGSTGQIVSQFADMLDASG